MTRPGLIAGCILAIFALPVVASPIGFTVTSNYHSTYTGDGVSLVDTDVSISTSVPQMTTVSAEIAQNSSVSVLSVASSDFGALIRRDDIHAVQDDPASTENGAAGSTLDFRFRVAFDTTYTLSGLYHSMGDLRVWQEVYLYSYSTATYLFLSGSISVDTNPELFVLGAFDNGDNFNTMSGAVSGVLRNGNYQLYARHAIHDYEARDGSGNATGFVCLAIGSASCEIPEPTTLALMALGVAGLGYARRKGQTV